MTETVVRHCVVLPCSGERVWVLPQRCLGEIVTVTADADRPPDQITWRGEIIHVVDFGREGDTPWLDRRAGAGLVAVVLGQRGEAVEYFGVALRGDGLGVTRLDEGEMEDLPEVAPDYASAAFRMRGSVYEVPDLLALQRAVGEGGAVIRDITAPR